MRPGQKEEILAIPRLSILVVEDDEAMAGLLKLHLSNAGYLVTLAEDAVAAGHHVLKFTPDLIILDVNLPYMNGLEFAATLQADATVPHIPVIFITAHENFGPQAERLGADFLVKPFLKPRLLESVARNIRSGRAGVTLEMRVLQRGVDVLGSERALAAHLQVSQADLSAWVKGSQRPPSELLLAATDLLLGHGDTIGLGQLHSMAPGHDDALDFSFGTAAHAGTGAP